MVRHIFGWWKELKDIGSSFTESYGDKSEQDLADAITKTLESADFVLAFYDLEAYEGYAYVLYCKDGVWYEVSGGHCSCYGLEGQWNPQETHVEALKLRLADGSFGYERNFDQLCKMHIKEYLGATQ